MQQLLELVIKYLKPHRKMVLGLFLASLLGAVTTAVIPLFYGYLLDETLAGLSLKWLGAGLLLWLLLSLANYWLGRLVRRYADLLSAKVGNAMIWDFAERFLHLPISYLKDQKTGRLLNRFDRAAMRMENVIERVVFYFMPDLMSIAVIIFFLTGIHWSLSVLLVILLIFYAVVAYFKAKEIMQAIKKMNHAYQHAYGDFFEYLHSYETVKAFSAEDSVLRSLRLKLNKIVDARWKNALGWNSLDAWQESTFSFAFVIFFGFGAILLQTGQITTGNLLSFVGYIYFTFRVLSELGNYYNNLNRAQTEIKEATKIYRYKTETQTRRRDLQVLEDVKGHVEFDHVSFKYTGKNQPWVLDDICFEVKPGEVIALVGASGAGKSTLVDLISGYYLPSKGSVMIDDYNTASIDGKDLRSHLAVVPQEVSLFHESIAFNIAYGKKGISQAEIVRIAKAANAHEFILKFPKQYKSKVGERGVKLSVGQKQRIAIARALIRDPEILILDEATSALDSVTEKAVQQALKNLIRGRTSFIIAHRLSTVTHADRIFVLDQGKLAEIGSHLELLKKNGVYARLYRAQMF